MSVSSTSPATLFGGVWERIEDTFLLSSGNSYELGDTGGSEDAVVVAHTHPLENEDYYFTGKKKTASGTTQRVTVPTSGSNYGYVSTDSSAFGNFYGTKSKGVDGTGKNMPPYLVINVWKRVG